MAIGIIPVVIVYPLSRSPIRSGKCFELAGATLSMVAVIETGMKESITIPISQSTPIMDVKIM